MYTVIMKLIIIFELILVLSTKKLFFFKLKYSKISLKIKGTGNNNIFGNNPINYFGISFFPAQVKINGQIQETLNYSYYFNETINNVELIWSNNIINCSYMFYQCYYITEIDFSIF